MAKGRKSLSLTNFWKLMAFIGDEQMRGTLLVLMCLLENLLVYCCSPQPLTHSSFITSLNVHIILSYIQSCLHLHEQVLIQPQPSFFPCCTLHPEARESLMKAGRALCWSLSISQSWPVPATLRKWLTQKVNDIFPIAVVVPTV